jgi:preprotein translocase subunit YajC
MDRNGLTTLILIIFGLFIIYIIMRGRSGRMKKRMDERKHFRVRRE